MNVGQYVKDGGGERLPMLDAKVFRKEEVKGTVRGKILAVRTINSPKFHGLALDLKCSGGKYAFLTGFDRFDIGAIVRQLKSDETDDWIGQTLRFVTKKGSKGGVFVNVASK